MMQYKVGTLLHKPQGSREHFSLDDTITLENLLTGQKSETHVTGDVELLKLPHEINVQIKDLSTKIPVQCNRCLKKFTLDIDIPLTEREFIIDLEERDLQPGEEVFFINLQNNIVDLTGMVQEELLLHFPAATVCSEGCKGLCDRCGTNLNLKTCDCPPKRSDKISPFKYLK